MSLGCKVPVPHKPNDETTITSHLCGAQVVDVCAVYWFTSSAFILLLDYID
jgi:hypothetical protein